VIGDLRALARGAGSTWVGAPEPSDANHAGPAGRDRRDPDQDARRWFVLLPGVRRAGALGRISEGAVRVPGGLAIRTTWLGLETLRSRVLAAVQPTLDAPCYPIDGDD
jgi:hypothetical protein